MGGPLTRVQSTSYVWQEEVRWVGMEVGSRGIIHINRTASSFSMRLDKAPPQRLGARHAVKQRLGARQGVKQRLGARLAIKQRLGARLAAVKQRLGARLTVKQRLGARLA
jgi:hypothetical protein